MSWDGLLLHQNTVQYLLLRRQSPQDHLQAGQDSVSTILKAVVVSFVVNEHQCQWGWQQAEVQVGELRVWLGEVQGQLQALQGLHPGPHEDLAPPQDAEPAEQWVDCDQECRRQCQELYKDVVPPQYCCESDYDGSYEDAKQGCVFH